MTEIIEKKQLKLKLTSSPHIHSDLSSKKAMFYVIIALLPCIISSLFFFGARQFLIILTSVLFAAGAEFTVRKIRKQESTLSDGSAFLTGLLLALILPPDFSLSSTAIGSVVSIVIGKEVFGGLGCNIFNPALVGRAFLQAAFPVPMTTWVNTELSVDALSAATPLSAYKFDKIIAGAFPMFLGNTGGSLGETSAIAILAGGIFLVFMKIVNWRIPFSIIMGSLVFSGIFYLMGKTPDPLFHILAGGLLFGSFFMATDWVTSPLTEKGMWIYGVGIAFLVIIIRVFGGLPEGVMYSILLMNAFVPLINKFTIPVIFGGKNE